MTRSLGMVRNAIVNQNPKTVLPAHIVADQLPQSLQTGTYAVLAEMSPNVVDSLNTAETGGQARLETQVIQIQVYAADRPTCEACVEEFKTLLDAVMAMGPAAASELVASATGPQPQWLEYMNDWIVQDTTNRNLYTGTIEYRVHTQRMLNPTSP